MSYSVGHINVNIRDEGCGLVWFFTGFYKNPVTELREESWRF